MLRQRQPRKHDDRHLDFIRSLPCVVCLDNTTTEAAHVRKPDPRAAKYYTGKSEKPDDCWTLPLCGKHHREQHSHSEAEFWQHLGIDPTFICLALHRVSGDHQAGEQIISMAAQS